MNTFILISLVVSVFAYIIFSVFHVHALVKDYNVLVHKYNEQKFELHQDFQERLNQTRADYVELKEQHKKLREDYDNLFSEHVNLEIEHNSMLLKNNK